MLRRLFASQAAFAATLARCWNWKSALLSSLVRALIFLCANLTAGLPAAVSAMSVEFIYRAATAGFHGRLTQALGRIEPAWRGAVAATLLLPVCGHSLEALLHWLRGTPNLRASLTASVCFTVVSTLFNWYAMRRGAFTVGRGSASLQDDFRRVPVILLDFMLAGPRLLRSIFTTG